MEVEKTERSPQPALGRRKLAFSDIPLSTVDNDPMPPSVSKGSVKSAKKPYDQMILEAIAENDPKRKGVSFAMVQKLIKGKHMIDGDIKVYVKRAYEKLSEKKMVEHVTGSGLNGSIRLSKEHVESMKKKEKLDMKAKKIVQKKAPEKKAEKSDKNNNKKDAKPKAKPKGAKTKVNPKKTAITKTKIDRSGGKVRLSISTMPAPHKKGPKMTQIRESKSEEKASGAKVKTAKKDDQAEGKDSKKPKSKKPTAKKASKE